MPALTKQEKLDMVSKAIDAGFKIELVIHRPPYKEAMELLPIFDGLSVKYTYDDSSKHTWAWINEEKISIDRFGATIHFE